MLIVVASTVQGAMSLAAEGCMGCQNRSHEQPLSPAQCYPATLHLQDVINREGVTGAAYIEVTADAIDVARLTSTYAACDECGAISTFLGITRNHYKGQRVEKLEYEAFTSMAIKQMTHIAQQIIKDYEMVHRVIMSHRIGVVPVGEASVFLSVTSEHRESGLAAVAFAINTLKERVPVWKREYYVKEDGDDQQDSVWKRNPEAMSPVSQKP